MNKEDGVMVRKKAEIDTRPPFRSVKEAVSLFGEKVLAQELYATQLKEVGSLHFFLLSIYISFTFLLHNRTTFNFVFFYYSICFTYACTAYSITKVLFSFLYHFIFKKYSCIEISTCFIFTNF